MPKPPARDAARSSRRSSGLSLGGFASAKQSTYDKQHRKEKERALNAKTVNKYRKLKARLQAASGAVPEDPAQQNIGEDPSETQQEPQRLPHQFDGSPPAHGPAGKRSQHGGKRGKPTQLQRINQEKQEEQAAAKAAKQEQRRAAEQRKQDLVHAAQNRKQQRTLMRKKTRTGQPVMKYRIGKILEHLQHDR